MHKFSKEIILKSGFSYAMITDTKNHMMFGYKDPVNEYYMMSWQQLYVLDCFSNKTKSL